jgi:hypothetical protein
MVRKEGEPQLPAQHPLGVLAPWRFVFLGRTTKQKLSAEAAVVAEKEDHNEAVRQ